MKKYFCFIFAGLILLVLLSGCTFTDDLFNRPLSEEEQRFLGHWQHIHGFGNVWNKEFSDDRSVHSWGSNLIFGDSEGFYIWEADGDKLVFYNRDSWLLEEEAEYSYTFNSATELVLDGNEYELQ